MNTTDAVLLLHAVAAIVTLCYLPVVAAWGIWEYRQGRRLSPAYDRALWAAQALLLIQVLAGVAALLAGRTPRDPRHVIDGSVASVLVFLVYLVARRDARISLYLGLSCAATIALA